MYKVGFDLDGVIANFHYTFKLEMIKKYGYDIEKPIKRGQKITHNIKVPNVSEKQITDDIYSTLVNLSKFIEPYSDVKEALQLFYSYYNKPIKIVTARDVYRSGVKEVTEEWLKNTFPEIEFDIVFKRHKEKALYLKENKYDTFVEDRLRNANNIAQVVRRVFLIDRLWNVDRETKLKVIRVGSLRQAVISILEGV